MDREINLINYLPSYIKRYREIQQITNTENLELQLLADESERVKNNQFIFICNETGISRFESLLNITPEAEEPLDLRISRVLMRWNDMTSYTWKTLVQKLDILCGENNYKISSDSDNYMYTLNVHLDMYGQLDELQNLIAYMIPANICMVINNIIDCSSIGSIFAASGLAICDEFTIIEE